MKKIVLLALVVATVTISWPSTYANYLFGTFSEDNSTEEYTEIEKQKNIHIPMVGYIFDSFTTNEERILKDAVKTL